MFVKEAPADNRNYKEESMEKEWWVELIAMLLLRLKEDNLINDNLSKSTMNMHVYKQS